MTQDGDKELLRGIQAGDERAFEEVYVAYQERVRLMAWRMARRADRVDDLFNETWCRAFGQRTTFDANRPFLVWMAGILKNVHRESIRKNKDRLGHEDAADSRVDGVSPEMIASEAESLAGLQDCVENLGTDSGRIVRCRFFEGKTLRVVAQELNIPESTLRDTRLPAIMAALKKCLEKKG